MSKETLLSVSVVAAAVAALGWMLLPSGNRGASAAPMLTQVSVPVDINESPAVLELFTSQGCSSCPPADALVGRLAKTRGDILVISRPVTYWDRLGWRDTLAKPENTNLQRAYAARGLSGRNGVYTPQAVINGRGGVVGSNAARIEGLLKQTAPQRKNAPQLAVLNDSAVTISGPASGNARLSLVSLDSQESVSIALGENRDRTITYTNLLVDEAVLGTWNDNAQTFTLPANFRQTAGADKFALILREGRAGPILAARRL